VRGAEGEVVERELVERELVERELIERRGGRDGRGGAREGEGVGLAGAARRVVAQRGARPRVGAAAEREEERGAHEMRLLCRQRAQRRLAERGAPQRRWVCAQRPRRRLPRLGRRRAQRPRQERLGQREAFSEALRGVEQRHQEGGITLVGEVSERPRRERAQGCRALRDVL